MTSKIFVLVLLLVCGAFSQECPDLEDKVTDLKSINPAHRLPCMYSGYIKLDEETDSNIFYWLFRAENEESNKPLAIWLNGGPGASSQIGTFIENGPLRLVKDEEGNTRVDVLDNISWTGVANVLYVDQPFNVGYSYGMHRVRNCTESGMYMRMFMTEFYKIHPELKDRELLLTGESYAGKYIPCLASDILDYNAGVSDAGNRIPLKSVVIGNPFFGGVSDVIYDTTYLESLGLIQSDERSQSEMNNQRCMDSFYSNDTSKVKDAVLRLGYITEISGGMDMYDSRYPYTNETSQADMLTDYLNDPDVQVLLHSESNCKDPKFAYESAQVKEDMMADMRNNVLEFYQKLLENNINVLIYAGNFDAFLGTLSAQEGIKNIQWKELEQFYKSPTSIYYYKSDDNDEVRVGGNYKQYKNLNFLTVYNAGHLVPATQLALSREFLRDMISNGRLTCNHENKGCNTDTISCEYMNNCNKNGECVAGKCECNLGYFGADCSIKPEELGFANVTINSTSWTYFELPDKSGVLTLSSTPEGSPIEVYMKKKGLPSRSLHDFYIKDSQVNFYMPIATEWDYLAIHNPSPSSSIQVRARITNKYMMTFYSFWTWAIVAFMLLVMILGNLAFLWSKREKKEPEELSEESLLEDSIELADSK